MPPQTSNQGEAKILGSRAVWNRVAGHQDSPWGDGASAGEEYDLGLNRVEGEATGRPPVHKSGHRTLDVGDQSRRIRAPAKDSTVVSECYPQRVIDVDKADGIIKSQRPEAGRAYPPEGSPCQVCVEW